MTTTGPDGEPTGPTEVMRLEREMQLSRIFVELADTLVDDFDAVDFLHVLTRRCVELVDVDAAGLLLADDGGRLRPMAASTEQVRLLELFELQNEEGPCLECYRHGLPVAEDHLDSSDRWPIFGPEAVAAGFRAVEAVPMRLRGERIGTLNLFRSPPDRLEDSARSLCQGLADVATIGLLQERTIREARLLAEQLQAALNNRVVIEQAKGVLSERAALPLDEAFEALRSFARSNNLRLAVVARDLIDGRLPVDGIRERD